MGNLPTNKQILALTDINPIIQYLWIHGVETLFGLFIIWIMCIFIDLKKSSKMGKVEIGIDFFTPLIIVLIFCEIALMYFVGETPLNEKQVKFIKSIDDTVFQSVMIENVQADGANLYAVKKTLKFVNNKEKYQSIELFNKTEP